MATARSYEKNWVSAYDSELDQWVSWDQMQEDWYKERSARRLYKRLHHPMFWAMQSNWLHLSAHCLWAESNKLEDRVMEAAEQQKIALMLAGMSLECGIKSRMIALSAFPLNPADQKRIFSGAHDLVALARSAGIRTNKSDRGILQWLSAHIRWLGRYPTPKFEDEMVRFWVTKAPITSDGWGGICRVREKIGSSVTRAIRGWEKASRRTEASASN